MTKELPRFADGQAVANKLADHPELGKITKAIRGLMLAQSCAADLAQAEACCISLDYVLGSSRKKGTEIRAAIENSLLINAIGLYSRATRTNGQHGERGAMNIVSKLSEDQRVDHEVLTQARNRASAHVYVHERIGEQVWHHQKMFFMELEPRAWKAACTTSTLQHDVEMLKRLKRQIPPARAFIETTFNRHMNDLTNLMNKYPTLQDTMTECLFDPVKWFGSENAVRQVVKGSEKARAISFSSAPRN